MFVMVLNTTLKQLSTGIPKNISSENARKFSAEFLVKRKQDTGTLTFLGILQKFLRQ